MIDLLPDREPATVEAWLRARPSIQFVAQDRNGGYGGAVTRAMPEAIQVADRWHLLEVQASHSWLPCVEACPLSCPWSDDLEHERLISNGGPGLLRFQFMLRSVDAASGASRRSWL